MSQPSCYLVTWDEIKKDVYAVNKTFAKIIDDLEPGDKKLVVATYEYGDYIVKKGETCLPQNNISETDKKHIEKLLSYSPIPLSFVLEKATEVCVETDQIIPLNVINTGEMFGTFEVMQCIASRGSASKPVWDVLSGACSTFALPKISDAVKHDRIRRKYSVKVPPPKHLADHHAIFREIIRSEQAKSSWLSKILFFTNDWFVDDSSKTQLKFKEYVFKIYWEQMQLFRDMIELRFLWKMFSSAINNKNLRPNNYIIETVKYLVSVIYGGFLCFKPATDNLLVPADEIQLVYLDDYILKDYIPSIMVPSRLEKEEMGYYSLSHPLLLDAAPKENHRRSLLAEERTIKQLLEIFAKIIPQKNELKNLKHAKYWFYHSEGDSFGDVENSELIVKRDKRFLKTFPKTDNNKFCTTSPFFTGCIGIKRGAE